MGQQQFTNNGSIAIVIGDTTVAAGATDVITDAEMQALLTWHPAASFQTSFDDATEHWDSMPSETALTSED